MFYVKQSESTAARRRVPILMVDETDGSTPETGLFLYTLVSKNGGTFAGAAGTFTETGYGQYYYQFDSSEIDTLGFAGIHVTAVGARNYDAIVHITAYDAYAGSFIAPTDVWNADISSITTAGTAGSQLNLVASGGAGITAGDVWEYDISAISTAGSAGTQLNIAAIGGAGISAQDVWEYVLISSGNSADATLGDAKQYALQADSQTQATNLRPAVWDFDINSGFANTVIPYPLGYIIQAGDATTTAAADVWSYATRTLTSGGAGITAGDVWDFNITGFGATGSAAQYVTQTNFTVGNIETYVANQTPQDVWTYAGVEGRTITGGSVTSVVDPVSITTTSMSGVAGSVWNSAVASYSTNGTFGLNILRADTANKVGDVTLRSAGGINMVDADIHRIDNDVDAATNLKNALTGIGASWTGNIVGNVTGSVNNVVSPVDITTAAMAGAANTVWTVASRTITGGIADTVTSVTNTVDISTQSVTDIWSEDVSAYSTPSAGYDLTQAASGGVGITAGDVWSYDISAITGAGLAGSQLNLAASAIGATSGDIATAVWDYTGSTIPTSTKETLESANTNASNAASNTGASSIRDAVWDTDLSYLSGTTQAAGILYEAAAGTTLNAPSAVWSYATRTLTSGGGITAGDVWTYDVSAITSAGTAGSQLNLAALPSAGSGLTAGDVWAYDITSAVPNSSAEVLNFAKYYADVAQANTNDIGGTVWGYDATLAGSIPTAGGYLVQAGDATTTAITAADVWSYSPRTITGGSVTSVVDGVTVTTNNDKTGYSLSASQTFDLTGNISGSVGSVTNAVDVSNTSLSAIASTVWTAPTRTLTTAATGITAGDVWDYAGGRTITGGIITTNNDKTGYSLSASQTFDLTGNITGNLSGSVGSVTANVGLSTATQSSIANSVWGYATRTLTSSGTGITAGDVWDYAGGRTITGGTVGTVTNGVTVTTNNDKTGYALSVAGVNAVQSGLSTLTQAQVGTEVDSSLADVGLTSTVTGRIDVAVSSRLASASYVAPPTEASIANTVWTTVSRTITGGTVADVTNPVNVSSASMSGIAGTVWSYGSRTLTSGAGATAGDIWNYDIDGITTSGSAAKQLNDAAVSGSVVTVVNGPYVLTSIAEGTDGQLDILRNSVQSIQLNLVDGNGSPFNIGGNYTVDVDVYDVSGALAANYTPTVDFAGNGIISFDIDTDVTGTDGRYTLVVSLTDGDVIKLGPLNILVRPL